MFLGIDIGTSSVKAIVIDSNSKLVGEASVELQSIRPGPLMSEQNPIDWWEATNKAVTQLTEFGSQIEAIGLSGQMHGAVLLDAKDQLLRNAILWNDGRSGSECEYLEQNSNVRQITGNAAMPGFTAPKLLWVEKHEPEVFRSLARVLLPKDYVRLQMTGDYATDLSDAAGTLWLDTASRCWSEEMLDASHLSANHMPTLFEGNEVTGVLLPDVARTWGMRRVPVVGGAGDQAAGAIGAGSVRRGRATLSLGTSGVLFAPDNQYQSNPDEGVHTFCHALPDMWHQMGVVLAAAGSLSWVTDVLSFDSETALMRELETLDHQQSLPIFLPYLTGERTPHNNPLAKGAFVGLDLDTTRTSMAWSVLEGVAFALRDCQNVLLNAGADLSELSVIGGGTQSDLWGHVIADILNTELTYRSDAVVGPALGAAQLAILGSTTLSVDDVCFPAEVDHTIEPSRDHQQYYDERYQLYRDMYQDLVPTFDHMSAGK